MGSSISKQNHKTASEDRDASETASEVRNESVTGSHLFKVSGYSLNRGTGIGKCIESGVFRVGGYDWAIEYYPDGYSEENKSYIAFFARLKSRSSNVKVQFTFTILQPNGLPSNMKGTTKVETLKSFSARGYEKFVKRTKFEASGCLNDDSFTLKCSVTVIKTEFKNICPYDLSTGYRHLETAKTDPYVSSFDHQNPETASSVQTETVTGSHLFKVSEYSLNKNIGRKKYIESGVFTVGGYEWAIRYYPDRYIEKDKSYMAFFLELKSKSTDVKAQFEFTMLKQNGVPSNMSSTFGIYTFRSTTGTKFSRYGKKFAERSLFEASECLKGDAFTVKCTVAVVKGTKLKQVGPYGVPVPSSNMNKNLVSLLKGGKGADVSFVVKGEKFDAHRTVLAVRSAVFQAELFGGMEENLIDSITIHDIEPPVFKSMLHFIYSDSVPDFEGTSDDDGEKQDVRFMAQHLLVAADRYGLERLRLMCEDLLSKNLCVCNAATTLILAERHNCSQLKAQCLRYMSSLEVFKAVALADEFHDLVKICPSIFKDGCAQCHC